MADRYTGPPATIGNLRRNGCTSFSLHCSTETCRAEASWTFDELGLPDAMEFPAITRIIAFQCKSCGARVTEAAPTFHYVPPHMCDP